MQAQITMEVQLTKDQIIVLQDAITLALERTEHYDEPLHNYILHLQDCKKILNEVLDANE